MSVEMFLDIVCFVGFLLLVGIKLIFVLDQKIWGVSNQSNQDDILESSSNSTSK